MGPAIPLPALERVDIAECAGVGKVEDDDIVTVVGGSAAVMNPHGMARAQGARERYRGEEQVW